MRVSLMRLSLLSLLLLSVLISPSNAQNRFDLGGGGVGSTTDKMIFKQKEGTPAIEIRGDNHGVEYLDQYSDLGAQGSFRIYTKNSPNSSPNQFPAPGGRRDRFWGIMYNADPNSTGGLSAIVDEPYFGFRWEDNWWQRQPPFAGELLVIKAISYSNPYTSITIDVSTNAKSTFKQFHTNCYVKKYTNANVALDATTQWKVFDIVSPGVLRVLGNATADLAVNDTFCFTGSVIEHQDVIGRVGEPSQERFMAMQIAREVPVTLQEIISDNWKISDAAGCPVIGIQSPYYYGSSKNGYVTGTIVSDSDNGSDTTFVITPPVAHSSWVGKQFRFYGSDGKWKHNTISTITNDTTIVCNGVVHAGYDGTKFQVVTPSSLSLTNLNISIDNNRGIQTTDTAGNGHNILMSDITNQLVVGHRSFDSGVFLHKPILTNYQDGETCIVLGWDASSGGSNFTSLVNDDDRIIKFGSSTYNSGTKVATFRSTYPHIAMQAATSGGPAEIRMGTGAWSALDTNLYRHAADILATDDDFAIRGAGKGLRVAEGSNAKMGTATLVAGEAVVSTTAVGANSRIFLTSQVDGGTPGFLRVSTRSAGTSFTITSGSGSDTSTVAWLIIEPSP